jgi:hypothetical protein
MKKALLDFQGGFFIVAPILEPFLTGCPIIDHLSKAQRGRDRPKGFP